MAILLTSGEVAKLLGITVQQIDQLKELKPVDYYFNKYDVKCRLFALKDVLKFKNSPKLRELPQKKCKRTHLFQDPPRKNVRKLFKKRKEK